MHHNIWKILVFRGISELMFAAPIMVPFYLWNRLSSVQLFVVQAIFAVAMLVFEVPSGYLSDHIGRIRTLAICGFLYALGFGIYALSSSFWAFVAAELVLALSLSLKSGTDSAVLFESANAAGREQDVLALEGHSEFWQRAATGVASIVGGAVAAVSLRLPMWLNAVPGVLMLGVALWLQEPPRTRPKGVSPLKDLKLVVQRCWSMKSLRAASVTWGVTLSVGIVCVWAYFLRLAELGFSVAWFGVLFALFQFSSAAGAASSGRLATWAGERRLLLALLAIPMLIVALAFGPVYVVIPAMLLHAALWGVSTPIFLTQLNRDAPDALRATLISVASMASRALFVVLAPAFGYIADARSLPTAFVLLAAFFLMGTLIGLGQAGKPNREAGEMGTPT